MIIQSISTEPLILTDPTDAMYSNTISEATWQRLQYGKHKTFHSSVAGTWIPTKNDGAEEANLGRDEKAMKCHGKSGKPWGLEPPKSGIVNTQCDYICSNGLL